MDDARQGLCREPLQWADRYQHGQREAAAGGLELLHGRAGRPRGTTARRQQHDVRGDSLPERPLRLRPDRGGLPAQVEIPPVREPGGDRHRLLRRDQPRSVLRAGQDRLQPARRPHRRGRRGHGEGALEDPSGGRQSGRIDADGAARGPGSSNCGDFGRRVRGARLGEGARPRVRPDRVDRLQRRP